jgi:hypothetical protein
MLVMHTQFIFPNEECMSDLEMHSDHGADYGLDPKPEKLEA